MKNRFSFFLRVLRGEFLSMKMPEKLSFEDALRELDKVVAHLEEGRISLEESLQLMQRGIHLADACDETLAKAEAVLEQLVADDNGELVPHRLQWSDDEESGDE